MVWQDLAISIVNIVLCASLVPEVYLGFKEGKGFITLRTSAPTTFCLYALSFIYYSLNLQLSAVTAFIMATLWLLFLIQRILYKRD